MTTHRQAALGVPLNDDPSSARLVRHVIPVTEEVVLQARTWKEKLENVQSTIETAGSALEFGKAAHEVIKSIPRKHRSLDSSEGADLGARTVKDKVEHAAENVESTVETAGQAVEVGKTAKEAFKVLKVIHRREVENLD